LGLFADQLNIYEHRECALTRVYCQSSKSVAQNTRRMLLSATMSTPVTIAKATITMEEGLILRWLKAEGDLVVKDEVLFEMETDKALVEVGAPADGVLLKILVSQGPVKVESVVGWIGKPGDILEDLSDKPIPAVERFENFALREESRFQPGRVVATPAARRRAAELKIDLASLHGSTPSARIVQEDVERAAALRSSATEESPPRLENRKLLIERFTTTWQSVPHIHVARYLDVDGLMEAKKDLTGTGTSVTDLILWVLARILPQFPGLTTVWEQDRLIAASKINLAFAVDTSRGVVAPVIASEGALTLASVTARRRELMEAAQARRLRAEDLQGGVFTLTNLGMQGVDFFAPLINAPQTAILATGKISQVPVVSDGALAVGWRMWVNLAVDHRVTDGMAAAQFLEQLQVEVTRLPEKVGEGS
jgi:pyruvate dehydrogenase E2 component (dihydrolipoamide acetyltransferase)